MSKTAGLFCKSYRDDFLPLRQLLDSFAAHNPENLILTLSLPAQDIGLFTAQFGSGLPNVTLVTDESYCGHDLSQYSGWYGQQICKLMSGRVVDAEYYAVLDSDCYVIADIHAADFLPSGEKPFVACGSSIRTVLKPDNIDLLAYINGKLVPSPGHFPQKQPEIIDRLEDFLHYRELDPNNPDAMQRSAVPFEAFGNTRWLYYQPGQIFTKMLLQNLLDFFTGHGLTAGDAIKICPWEYNWYGEYAATHGFDETEFKVSPYLHFQSREDLVFARMDSFKKNAISNKFLFIQMAARHLDDLKL